MNPATSTLTITEAQPPAATIPPLSQSRQTLMACPHLYRERIVRGIAEADNPYAARGTQIHVILANYVQHLMETRQASDYAYYDLLIAGKSGETLELLEHLRDGLLFDPQKILDVERCLALDEDMQPIEHTEPGVPLLSGEPAYEGTPDVLLVPDAYTVEIWDWKSYYQVIDADTFQAKLYPLLVFKHYPGIQRVRFRLEFIRYGVTREVTYTRSADLPKLEKLARAERARQLALHQEADKPRAFEGFGAMPGSHCAWCPKLFAGCPIAEINPYTSQTAQDRVRFAVWLAVAKKENDRVLKDLVNASGPVAVQDGNGKSYAADFELQHQAKYPLTAYSTISANEPELVAKLTISGLDSYLKTKKRAALRELLEQVKFDKTQTRFAIKGSDADEAEEGAE